MKFIRDYLARRRIKEMFGAYLSPALVDKMVASGQTPEVAGGEREITPFFANLQGYVGIAEKLPLAQLPEFMNAYLAACSEAVSDAGGTLDKHLGDCVVAMFGAPMMQADHAFRACQAALQAQMRFDNLRARYIAQPERWPELVRQFRVRIGLHTGMAIVGNMGTAVRFNYTMMGDNVNLAARLEKGAKSYGVWVLCTDATKRACETSHPDRILFRSLGRIIVKGRALPIELFEPVALREDVTVDLQECVNRFARGHARFCEHDWKGAIELFRESAALEPHRPDRDDGITLNPSLTFTKMAESFLANPDTKPFVV